jgi:hypothetical protein
MNDSSPPALAAVDDSCVGNCMGSETLRWFKLSIFAVLGVYLPVGIGDIPRLLLTPFLPGVLNNAFPVSSTPLPYLWKVRGRMVFSSSLYESS